MRKILLNISIAALLLAQAAIAQDSSSAPATTAALSFGSSIYSSALARADVAVAKSVVTPSLLRGETGEAIRNQRVTGYMHRSGRWLDISPRLGPQGLDHVSVQLDENNVPARLMVDETKFGSARLLRTVRGDIQMGDRYLSDRLSGLAKRYRDIATQMRASMPTAKMPLDLSSRRIMVVPLSETESVQFWRSLTAPGEWYYDGPLEVRADAIRQLDRLALLHESAASGKIRYRRRIFQVKADGDAFTVTIRDAAKVDVVNGDLSRLPISGKILVAPAGAPTDSAVVEATLAAELKRQMPHLDFQEARQLASGVREVAASMEERLSRHSFTRYVAMESVKVGGVTMLLALPLETALTLLSGDSIDWSRTAGLAALGELAQWLVTHSAIPLHTLCCVALLRIPLPTRLQKHWVCVRAHG